MLWAAMLKEIESAQDLIRHESEEVQFEQSVHHTQRLLSVSLQKRRYV